MKNDQNHISTFVKLALTLLVLIFIFDACRQIFSTNRQAQQTELTEPEAPPVAAAAENFPAADFTAARLVLKYQSGLWDGSPIKSSDGKHIASVTDTGKLRLDGKVLATYVDLDPHEDNLPYQGLYHDDSGTYLAKFSPGTSTKTPITRWDHGVAKESYEMPYDAFPLAVNAVHLDGVIIMKPITEDVIIRFNPASENKFEQIDLHAIATTPIKITPTAARFRTITYDESGALTHSELLEIGPTGAPKVICKADHLLNVRATTDYPAQGDYNEFWLLRLAYTMGFWDGQNLPVSEILELVKTELKSTNPENPTNSRQPALASLNVSALDPTTLAYIDETNGHIVLDNIPKYYLHATAAWQVDDIFYRKINALTSTGFAEIDVARENLQYAHQSWPVQQSPVCRFSYATTPKAFVSYSDYDLTSTAVVLPYYNYAHLADHGYDAVPENFTDRLEFLSVINSAGALRAIAIGEYDGPAESAAATCKVYLSRHNSEFVEIARGVIEAHFYGHNNADHINGNYDMPFYDAIGLWLSRTKDAFYLDNVFSFNNDLVEYDS